ncbi:hypothetical protein BKA61DRAFT_603157 [Leptodontidium sp. MPI-SDFR-AT-0119]|nr:hypothetical protein BKA61DRAFT_603157 [Leptodontidium sp. MPI-SDFR-AT-0119]
MAATSPASTTPTPTSITSTVASSTITGVPPGMSGLSELDIIFPQPNQTYPQVSPFPVVFAIQNPQVVYSYHFFLDWTISLKNCTATNLTACNVPSSVFGGRISTRPDDTGFPIPASIDTAPLFAYVTGPDSRSLGYGIWELTWGYYLSDPCRAGASFVEQYGPANLGRGSFLFTLASTASPTNPLPSVCPTSAGMVSILGTVTMGAQFVPTFSNCPTTASSPPASATPCAAMLDGAGATSILRALNATVVTPTAGPTATGKQSSAMPLRTNLLGHYVLASILISALGLLY